MVPEGAPGAPSGVEAEPEGASALASPALVCPLSPAPADTAFKEGVWLITHRCAALR